MDLSPDEENFQGRLLHQAALWDNLELLQELLASGAEVDARDAHMRSALHAAALAERSSCLPALCAAGADVNAKSDQETGGKTALHIASERGHVENVKALLGAGADLTLLTADGDSALVLAEKGRHRHASLALREAKDALDRERVSQHAQLRELVVRGDAAALKARLAALGSAGGIVANLTPGGANTLLYVAAELGAASAAAALVAAGADGRAHPVTRYGPLYIACYHGHLDIAKLLLQHFPEAVQQETVEKWLPLHAACIGGHPALVTLLLEYTYPEHLLSTYTDASGKWQYRIAFDVNARDASGQTALYVACTLGNAAVVDALLAYTVPVWVKEDEQSPPTPATPAPSIVSPQRSGISLGIHAIVSKLTSSTKHPAPDASVQRVRPVRVEASRGVDSCVACAARLGHARVLKKLLAAGARADTSAMPPQDLSNDSRDTRRRSRSASVARSRDSPSPGRANYSEDREGPWTALAIAARAKNAQVVEMLLAAGATDPGGRALRECARHGLADLLAALLATRAYPDPEYKVNKSLMSERVLSSRDADPALSYRARCPTTAVLLNWRELRAHLTHIKMSWVRAAAARVNPRVSAPGAALLALTRLELANNELRVLPRELFGLISLRYLNVAQNKLERLPTGDDLFEEEMENRQRKGKRVKRSTEVYTAPVLQELYLQDNRLEELPPELFSLPALASLDVSNNKLRALPPHMWRAPALRDLNAALNHLKELPTDDGVVESRQSPSEASPGASPSAPSAPYSFEQKSTSRSPSIASESFDDEDIPVLGNRAGNAVASEVRRAHEWRGARAPSPPRACPAAGSCLASLNLAHNQFSCVPVSLACRAPALTRLNMAYNNLRSMSFVTSYPTSLRQLDLSHNEITCWPSLPQVESFGSSCADPLACYCASRAARSRPRSTGSVRSQLMSAACAARRHLRLEGLRTLILANNMLTRIQLTTDDDGLAVAAEAAADDNDDEWSRSGSVKARLLFPLLSMLDVSCNLLRCVPPALQLLTNLAVLNLSGNKDITDLPPQMGLLTRLWNLNTVGCSLQEPLRSVVRGGRSRSVDVVGYLRSVLQEAKPYTRMKLMVVGVQGIGKTSLLECLRQESPIHLRRKPTEHWAKRMGNKSSRRGVSTVGVDIGAWVYEPQRSTRGPLTFRTWDFGGQQEYYATHQYFLSRRSLYLVLWRVTDGRAGLAGALHWLRSIQARAPGSPVIMVGTHYDQVSSGSSYDSESPASLQRLIRGAIMAAPDADKLGLPRVMDSIEVSCSSRHNIKILADIIYSVAFSVKPPGSKEPLLEQRVPATYLALEECVHALAERAEPVLRREEYRRLVTQYMQQRNLRMFRDAAELHQATMFLHENGVLLHYDDATLKELYFLNPQWLCDVLAHVVTVREINPFASNGIMKVEDLAHVFKASPVLGGGEEARSLAVSLLNKFELALCWDARALLVPPLLPADEPRQPQLFLKSRAFPGTPRRAAQLSAAGEHAHHADSPALIQDSPVSVRARAGGRALRRLLLLSYVPRGFWARLCARVLADPALPQHAPRLYAAPPELELDETVTKALELNWGWKLWKTGLKLSCGELVLLALRELPPRYDPLLGAVGDEDEPDELYHCVRFRVRQEGVWSELDVQSSACVEVLLPAHVCVVRRESGLPVAGCQSLSLEPNPEVLTKLLALISDHVDLLLEDWYPSLGTRFVHTSEGRCLITRVAPCPACLRDAGDNHNHNHDNHNHDNHNHHEDHDHDKHMAQVFRRLELGAERRLRLSEESRASDGDSGVGAESNASSRVGSSEGVRGGGAAATCWTLEECVLAACTSAPLSCPRHPEVQLADVAPDTLLLDVEEERRARWEQVSRTAVAGRGAFGTVLTGVWRRRGGALPVAVKALQPVAPPKHTDVHALQAYKAAVSRWERDACGGACRAYCGLRQELGILSRLRHAHVLPLLAVCAAPLALLLAVAPQGSLESALRRYRGCGARVGPRVARALALQVARALEYLHAHRVLYRDLKSENVLVWSLPTPEEARGAEGEAALNVHVKLGDYGISRLAPPSGTKGFGGTEGFMAPEIMRYNGEEEYTEKVDCFSYGMLLYEIFTLRQPFEGHEAVKEAVLEGARPPLSPRELRYPVSMLDMMRRCWSGAPELRPSAAALVALCAAPECLALREAGAARAPRPAAPRPAAAAPLRLPGAPAPACDLWYGGAEPERLHALLAAGDRFRKHHTLRVPPDESSAVLVTALCRAGARVWAGDSVGRVFVYGVAACELLWSARVTDAVGGAPGAVAALAHLAPLPRMALALACGRLFLVSSERPAPETSFVLTELGTATELCCLAVVPAPLGAEVWAGGDRLYTYSVSAEGVSAAESAPCPAAGPLALLARAGGGVLGACRPGTSVFSWCGRTRRVTSRLDCSKLAPCSESLQSIALDDTTPEWERCRVTALCVSGSQALVGTAWGCVVVAHAATLRPITVFRPYEEEVSAIVSLPTPTAEEDGPLVATFGAGYRPLLQRYSPAQSNNSSTYSGYYCLLWRAQHWLPD